MTDIMAPAERSARMARIKDRDTTPEVVVRSVLHRMGYRFGLHRKELPGGRILFPRAKQGYLPPRVASGTSTPTAKLVTSRFPEPKLPTGAVQHSRARFREMFDRTPDFAFLDHGDDLGAGDAALPRHFEVLAEELGGAAQRVAQDQVQDDAAVLAMLTRSLSSVRL